MILVDIEDDDGGILITAYRNHQATGQCIAALERQFEAFHEHSLLYNLDLFAPQPIPVHAQGMVELAHLIWGGACLHYWFESSIFLAARLIRVLNS